MRKGTRVIHPDSYLGRGRVRRIDGNMALIEWDKHFVCTWVDKDKLVREGGK